MIVYDDLSIDEKIKIYDKGVSMSRDEENIYRMKVDYRIGEMHSPLTNGKEALKNLTNHFRNCIDEKENPITSSKSGLRVVQTLEAAERSMENKGKPEKIE